MIDFSNPHLSWPRSNKGTKHIDSISISIGSNEQVCI